MAAALKLYIDTFRKRLVTSDSNGAIFNLPAFFQGDVVAMVIQLLEPDPSVGINGYTKPDISSMSLKFAVSATPTGTAGGPTPFVTQFTWTKDTTNRLFTANVAFNTTELNTWLGSAASRNDAYMEIEITEGSAVTTVLQQVFTINAEVIESSTSSVAAGQTALSLETALATFVKFVGNAGETITLTSPDGTKQRILGVDNDGNPIDYIV